MMDWNRAEDANLAPTRVERTIFESRHSGSAASSALVPYKGAKGRNLDVEINNNKE